MKTKRNKAAGRGRPSPTCSRVSFRETSLAGRDAQIEELTRAEHAFAAEFEITTMTPELARSVATDKWAEMLPESELVQLLCNIAHVFQPDSFTASGLRAAAMRLDPENR